MVEPRTSTRPTSCPSARVVEEEYRQRVLASPYGRFFERDRAGGRTSSTRTSAPGIGSIEDLEAATLADVRRLPRHLLPPRQRDARRRRRLRPEAARRLGRQVLRARCRSPAAPLPRFDATRAAVASDRGVDVTGPQVPLPAVALDLARAAGDERRRAGAAGRRSAARRRRIVAPEPVAGVPPAARAARPASSADLRVGPGLLIAYAIAASGKPPAEVQRGAARRGEAPGASAGPARPSWRRSRRSSLTQAFMSRQTPLGLASAIGRGGRARRRRGARQHRPRRAAARQRRRRAARACAATCSARTR